MDPLLYLAERNASAKKRGSVSFVTGVGINSHAAESFQFHVSATSEAINVYVSNMIQPLTFEPDAGHEMDSADQYRKAWFSVRLFEQDVDSHLRGGRAVLIGIDNEGSLTQVSRH